jgi:acetyltransferase-like isoleucine patch superfamily enzyme
MDTPLSLRVMVETLRLPWRVTRKLLLMHPFFRFDRETRGTQTPATVEAWLRQHVLGINRGPYWPMHSSSIINYWQNVHAGVETSPGLMPGCYISAIGKVYIGDYTQIAPNVGIISSNHSLEDNRRHEEQDVRIGAYCWIGMGAVILPGVTLGDFTVVGAGAIVSKSFPEGHCVLAGAPAKVIRKLDPAKCVRHTSAYEYHGYIPKADFEAFRKKHLST